MYKVRLKPSNYRENSIWQLRGTLGHARGGTRVLLARALLLLRFSKRRLTRYSHDAYHVNQTCDCRRFVLHGTIRVIG